MSDLYERLMAAADGDWGQEAAVDLLHRHRRWLPVLDEHQFITYDQDAYLDDGHGGYMALATVDWDTIALTLRIPYMPEDEVRAIALRAGSGSERQVLAAACSLGGGEPVRLRSGFGSLDHVNRRIVLHAIAHAMAGRTYAREVLPL